MEGGKGGLSAEAEGIKCLYARDLHEARIKSSLLELMRKGVGASANIRAAW